MTESLTTEPGFFVANSLSPLPPDVEALKAELEAASQVNWPGPVVLRETVEADRA